MTAKAPVGDPPMFDYSDRGFTLGRINFAPDRVPEHLRFGASWLDHPGIEYPTVDEMLAAEKRVEAARQPDVMTVRDQFAAQAMAAMVANYIADGGKDLSCVAVLAHEFADAMMTERARRSAQR